MAPKQQSLLLGTTILLISNILVKGLGFAYRVFLVRLLGAEGMGLIEMVGPLYSFLLVLGGFGIPLAISQKTAEEAHGSPANLLSIFKSGRFLLFFFGLGTMALAYLFLPTLMQYFAPDQRIYLALKAILPAIPIISLASAYRGHFQGLRQISNLAISQCMEQVLRVTTGLFFASRMLQLGLEHAVSATSYASVLGELAGLLCLLLAFRINKRGFGQKGVISGRRAFSLLRFGAPVTFTRLALSGIMMLQAFLIPIALQRAGWDTRAATEIYGRFSGVAMSLLHLPGVFTGALAVSVMPAVAETGLHQRELLRHRAANSLQATTLFTLPSMAVLYLFADELCTWLFHSPLAADILRVLCFGGCFLYLQTTLSSILQGLGEVRALLINSLIGGCFLLFAILLLASMPNLGITGAAVAVDIYFALTFALNLLRLHRISQLRLPWQNIVLKPAFATILGILIMQALEKYGAAFLPHSEKLAAVVLCMVFGLVYFIILVVCGGLSIGIWRRIKKR